MNFNIIYFNERGWFSAVERFYRPFILIQLQQAFEKVFEKTPSLKKGANIRKDKKLCRLITIV